MAAFVGCAFASNSNRWSTSLARSRLHPSTIASSGAPNEQSIQNDPKELVDERIATYTLWLALLTGVLSIATIGLMGTTVFQLRLARREFNATHRPELVVREVTLVTDPASKEDAIAYVLVNRGRNTCTVTGSAFELRSSHPGTGRPGARGQNEIGEVTLAPGEFRVLFHMLDENEHITAAAQTNSSLDRCFFSVRSSTRTMKERDDA
jgi:hypothetical protein